MAAERDLAFDLAKGIGIILVVFGHALRGLIAAGFIARDGWAGTLDYVIYAFHMPLFFVISGMFFRPDLTDGGRRFMRRLMIGLIYPYLLWSLIQGGVQIALARSGAVNVPMEIGALAQILWKPFAQFWFLYALVVAQVVAALLIGRVRAPVAALAGFALLPLAVATLPETLVLVSYGLTWLLAGLWARAAGLGTWRPARPLLWAAGLGAAGVLAALVCLRLGVPYKLPIPAALLLLGATLMLARALAERKWLSGPARGVLRALAGLGTHSMGIYILHILVLGAARLCLVKGVGLTDPALLLIGLTCAGLALPVLLQEAAARLHIDRAVGLPLTARRPGSR